MKKQLLAIAIVVSVPTALDASEGSSKKKYQMIFKEIKA